MILQRRLIGLEIFIFYMEIMKKQGEFISSVWINLKSWETKKEIADTLHQLGNIHYILGDLQESVKKL